MNGFEGAGWALVIVVVSLFLGRVFAGSGPDDPVHELDGIPPFLIRGVVDDEELAA